MAALAALAPVSHGRSVSISVDYFLIPAEVVSSMRVAM
jgi:hypothetical protein